MFLIFILLNLYIYIKFHDSIKCLKNKRSSYLGPPEANHFQIFKGSVELFVDNKNTFKDRGFQYMTWYYDDFLGFKFRAKDDYEHSIVDFSIVIEKSTDGIYVLEELIVHKYYSENFLHMDVYEPVDNTITLFIKFSNNIHDEFFIDETPNCLMVGKLINSKNYDEWTCTGSLKEEGFDFTMKIQYQSDGKFPKNIRYNTDSYYNSYVYDESLQNNFPEFDIKFDPTKLSYSSNFNLNYKNEQGINYLYCKEDSNIFQEVSINETYIIKSTSALLLTSEYYAYYKTSPLANKCLESIQFNLEFSIISVDEKYKLFFNKEENPSVDPTFQDNHIYNYNPENTTKSIHFTKCNVEICNKIGIVFEDNIKPVGILNKDLNNTLPSKSSLATVLLLKHLLKKFSDFGYVCF